MVKIIALFMRLSICWKEGPTVNKDWNLKVCEKLCTGSTCSVHRGVYGDKEVAIKRVKNRDCSNEIESLQKLKDEESIVHLYDFRTQTQETIFLTELCRGGDLIDYMMRVKKMTEKCSKSIIIWLLKAAKQCHDHKIAHLDIKLDNIGLFSPDDLSSLKLLDFGNSRPLADEIYSCREIAGTMHYLAPELLAQKNISGAESLIKVDIWTIGVVAYTLLLGAFPFKRAKDIVNLNFHLNDILSEDAKNFLKFLLSSNVDRPKTITDCLNHKWVRQE